MMDDDKTVEQFLCEKILFIGNEIPMAIANDKRDKFIELGCPQDVIDIAEKEIANAKKQTAKAYEDILISKYRGYLPVKLRKLLDKLYIKYIGTSSNPDEVNDKSQKGV